MSVGTVDDRVLGMIDRFDEQFTPSEGIMPGLDQLPDGDYSFEIVGSQLTVSPQKNQPIFRCAIRVTSKGDHQGIICANPWFLENQQNADILGQDLKTLGMDSDHWKAPHRPFSRELVKMVAEGRLHGVRFRGRKFLNDTYHNLRILSREAAGQAPPSYQPPSGAKPPTKPAPSGNGQADANTNSNEIPF